METAESCDLLAISISNVFCNDSNEWEEYGSNTSQQFAIIVADCKRIEDIIDDSGVPAPITTLSRQSDQGPGQSSKQASTRFTQVLLMFLCKLQYSAIICLCAGNSAHSSVEMANGRETEFMLKSTDDLTLNKWRSLNLEDLIKNAIN